MLIRRTRQPVAVVAKPLILRRKLVAPIQSGCVVGDDYAQVMNFGGPSARYPGALGATLSGCRQYRYNLWRRWDMTRPMLVFIMLNPSTAAETENDPTIRRCIGFAERLHYGGILVVNLFAFRTPDPRQLFISPAPYGGNEQESALRSALDYSIAENGHVICAWGTNVKSMRRWMPIPMAPLLFQRNDVRYSALKLTNLGHPSHPLYLPADRQPIEFDVGWYAADNRWLEEPAQREWGGP